MHIVMVRFTTKDKLTYHYEGYSVDFTSLTMEALFYITVLMFTLITLVLSVVLREAARV